MIAPLREQLRHVIAELAAIGLPRKQIVNQRL